MIALAGLLVQAHRYREETARITRFDLPAFDPYVYLAMAEEPRVFTVAPWGYRVLTPWIVHAISLKNVLRGYRLVTLLSFVAAGGFLYLYLRRVGHREWPCLAAVAAFALASPVAESLRTVVVVEPLTMALATAFLWAVEAGAGLAVLALLAALLAGSKEVWVLLLPLVFLTRREGGWPRALGSALLVGLPALLVTLLLRNAWVPDIRPGHAPLDAALVRAGWVQLRHAWPETWPALVLGGLGPLALLGAFRRSAAAFRRRYGWLALALVLLAFVAWVNVPSATPVPLFGRNVLRLVVYALPVLLGFGLFALVPPLTAETDPAATRADGRTTAWPAVTGWVVVAALVLALSASLDRYRRVPLHASRDGPLVLGLCRETLRVARRVEAGQEVTLDPGARRFEWGVSDPGGLSHMRWFLRDGWGEQPQYGTGDVIMAGTKASLLLPSVASRPTETTLGLRAETASPLEVSVNGQPLLRTWMEPGPVWLRVPIPAGRLFRGDNLLTLATGSRAVRVQLVGYRLAAPGR